MSLLSVRNLGKRYRLRRDTRMLTKEVLLRLLRRPKDEEFWALEGIDLEVDAGESLGIIGPNGSGKSTLLKIIAGVTSPTEGEISVGGRVSSLLELGAGFHPYLTGRENVYLNGAILGIDKEEIDRKFDRIVEFAGIERFIDTPVKDYSSGMYVRLAFSVAIHSDPDIFLVDEVLSVGDEQFQRKCRAKIRELRDSGKTIVFVSHDLNIVNELCNRVILLQGGKIVRKGSPEDTVDFYLQSVGSEEGLAFLNAGSLEVVFNNGTIAVCSEGHMLTSGHGCYGSIWSRGMWYDSMNASWFIESRSDTELVAIGTFTRIPFKQRWHIKLEGASLVQWDIEMESGAGTDISERTLSLMVTPKYTTWFTEEKAGEFPRIDPDDTKWVPVSPPDKQLNIMGVVTGESQPGLPSFCFETVKRAPDCALQILNSEYGLNARILQVLEVSADSEERLVPHKDLFTSARMSLGESPELIKERLRQARHQRAIDTGNLAAVFAGGGIHLVWKGIEITKGLRVFSSIQSGDFWDDSAQGYWQAERASDVGLRAKGIMRRLPATQTWILNELEDETIEWKILLDVRERIEAQEMDVSIMLVPEYDTWVTSHETGVFPPITAQAREWTHLTKLFKSSTFVEARCSKTHGGNLPPVRLSFGKPRVAAAVNTRHTEMARVIQGLEPYVRGSGIFEPGRYEIFSGIIAVGEH
jgi:ABC-type polysaccharide/polyol phosphate transport system ATPase subunit